MVGKDIVSSMKEYGVLDRELSDGRLTMESPGIAPCIRIRDLSRWCKDQGRSPDSLSKQEIDAFSC